MKRCLVLGVGNILYGDEGVGVHLLHRLRRRYRFPPGVELQDGGVLGWHLLPLLAQYPQVLLLDALAGEVGAVYRFPPEALGGLALFGKLSSHEWGILDLLWAMELHGDRPEKVAVVAMGVTPAAIKGETLEFGLSEGIRARLPAMEAVALGALEAWGIHPEPVPEAEENVDLEAILHA